MINDDRTIALNEVLAALEASADSHSATAAHGANAAVREFGASVEPRRRSAIEALMHEMSSADIMPRMPDPEVSGAAALLGGLKALVTTPENVGEQTLLERTLAEVDGTLVAHIEQATAYDLPGPLASALAHLDETVRADLASLETLPSAPDD